MSAPNLHAARPVFVVAHSLLVCLEVVDALGHVLVLVTMRTQVRDDASHVPIEQPGLDLCQVCLVRVIAPDQRLEGRRGVFQRVEHVQNVRLLHAGEKLVGHVGDPCGAVGDKNHLAGLVDAVSTKLAVEPTGKFRCPADATNRGGAVDQGAHGIAVLVLRRLAGLRVRAFGGERDDHLRLAGPGRTVLLLTLYTLHLAPAHRDAGAIGLNVDPFRAKPINDTLLTLCR